MSKDAFQDVLLIDDTDIRSRVQGQTIYISTAVTQSFVEHSKGFSSVA